MSLETSYIKSSTAGHFEDLQASIRRLGAKYSMLTFEQRLRMSVLGGEERGQGAWLAAAAVNSHGEILLLPFLLIVFIITL